VDSHPALARPVRQHRRESEPFARSHGNAARPCLPVSVPSCTGKHHGTTGCDEQRNCCSAALSVSPTCTYRPNSQSAGSGFESPGAPRSWIDPSREGLRQAFRGQPVPLAFVQACRFLRPPLPHAAPDRPPVSRERTRPGCLPGGWASRPAPAPTPLARAAWHLDVRPLPTRNLPSPPVKVLALRRHRPEPSSRSAVTRSLLHPSAPAHAERTRAERQSVRWPSAATCPSADPRCAAPSRSGSCDRRFRGRGSTPPARTP